jgi:hypothetical protein
MNLHNLVRGTITAVNPDIPVTVVPSTGSTENAAGRIVPAYGAPVITSGQKQPVTGREIERFQQQNIQGVTCKMHLNGNYEGLFRVLGKGGDLLQFGGQTYLVASVMERWPDWCCLALTLQPTEAIK